MQRGNPVKMRALLFSIVLLAGPVFAAVPDQITLYLPAFEGPGALGQNVATILNLRIWTTLRRKPWPANPDNLDFGKGLIVWNRSPLSTQSHHEAENEARSINLLAQMVLWGKAYPYGDGVVVQTNMSIPRYRDFRESRNEIWEIEYRDTTFKTDIPRRRFEVSSIVLTNEVVKEYSLPSALKIYADREGGDPIGEVGSSYRGIQLEPQLGLAKVIAGDITGWVRLPKLGKKPTEVSTFAAGVMKIFRSDWQGALQHMNRVIENQYTNTSLRIDAHLYAGMALERQGKSGREHFEKALELNPYARRAVEYLLMGEVAALSRQDDPMHTSAATKKILERLKSAHKKYAQLFPKNDPFIESISRMLR